MYASRVYRSTHLTSNYFIVAGRSEERSNGYWASVLPPPHPPGSQSVQREALNYSFCSDGGWFFKSLLKVEVKQKADWADGVQQCSQVGCSISVWKYDQRGPKPSCKLHVFCRQKHQFGFFAYSSPSPQESRGRQRSGLLSQSRFGQNG